jgi:hypothetical protein
MSEFTKQKVNQIILKGKWHFIFWCGVIGFGLTTAILFQITVLFIDSSSALSSLNGLIISLVIFPIGGIFWGASMWQVLYSKE